MKRFAIATALSIPLLVAGCAMFQGNPDSGEPEIDHATDRSVNDVVECLTQDAIKHGVSFKSTPIPQGTMLDFGDSNVVKVRSDNGQTSYRFYSGQRHISNLWLEGASKSCAP
ncbi:hypothetical protein [Trinickia mobilis]|uniref:hypothetical protein n=1 Tax=Trinickia mobilis TaxID=2816356 RepID=UPI001A8FA85E|nr:hypothetical protein [Trinickia mobilis]